MPISDEIVVGINGFDSGGGGGGGGTGVSSFPELWSQNDIPASQAATAMSSQVSQLFDTAQQIQGGRHISGLNIRFSGMLSGGSATATVTINGAPGTLAVTVMSGASSGRSTQASPTDSLSAGDVVGIQLVTDAGFAPVTLDAEAWVETEEV